MNLRFNNSLVNSLVDRYSRFFPSCRNDAGFLADPAHSWLEILFAADRRAHAGLADYRDQYYDRFSSEAGATGIRQRSDGAADLGSYRLTARITAGGPALAHR